MKISTILKRARKLITNPKKWTQGTYFRDREGNPVYGELKKAHSFCALGAVERVVAEGVEMCKASEFLDECAPDGKGMVSYNDAKRRTHEQVLQVFDRAIARAQEQNL